MSHARLLGFSLALAAALSACTPPAATLPGGSLSLAPVPVPVDAPVAVAPAVPAAPLVAETELVPVSAQAPATPAFVAAPVAAAPVAARRSGGGGSSSSAAAAPAGATLTIDLRGFLAALRGRSIWKLLSTVADVARIEIAVFQGGTTTATATLTQADIVADAVTKTFTGLTTGNAVLMVVAYDAAGSPIGSASQVVAITPTGTSVADLELKLVNAPGTSGPGNALDAKLVFTPSSGAILAAWPMNWANLLAAGDGYLYAQVVHHQAAQPVAFLRRHSPADGTMLQSYIIDATGTGSIIYGQYRMAYDEANHRVVVGSRVGQTTLTQPGDTSVAAVNKAYRQPGLVVDAMGEAFYTTGTGVLAAQALAGTTRTTTIPAHSAVAIDAAGAFWTNTAATSEVRRFAADGTPTGSLVLPFVPTRLDAGNAGGIWAADAGQVVHVAADGTVGAAIAATGLKDLETDAEGDIWLALGSALEQRKPDGTLIGSYPIHAHQVAFGHGYLYAGATAGPAGTPGGHYVFKLTP